MHYVYWHFKSLSHMFFVQQVHIGVKKPQRDKFIGFAHLKNMSGIKVIHNLYMHGTCVQKIMKNKLIHVHFQNGVSRYNLK